MPRTRALLFTAGVMVCLGRAPCLAASDPVHDPGIKIYRGQLEKERARALEGGDTGLWRVGPGAEAMTLDAIDEPGPSFPIHTLVQEGDRLLDDARFKRLTEQFLGKPLGLRRINYLLDQINRALVDMGYITSRAYVGRQNLKDGVLAVTIVAGRIERLLYNDQDASTARRGLGFRFVTAVDAGDILFLPDIEQTVDQLNRSRRGQVRVQIKPGEQAGGSTVEFSNSPGDTFQYQISADNQGSSGTGKLRLHTSIEAGGLLGFMESMNLGLTTSQETNALYGSLALPMGYWTSTVLASWSEYQNLIGDTALVYGTSDSASITFNRVIKRDGDSKVALDVLITRRHSERHVNNARLTPQTLAVARVGINRLKRFKNRHGTGQWTADVGVARGLAALGAQRDPGNLPTAAARAQFDKLDIDVAAEVPIQPTWNWRGRLVGQWSPDPLYSSEQIFAGGVGSVRGFQESAQGGDAGLYLRNEIGHMTHADLFGHSARIEPFVFLDAGYVKNQADGSETQLVGAGIGLRLGLGTGNLELILGRPLNKPDSMADAGTRLNFNFAYLF